MNREIFCKSCGALIAHGQTTAAGGNIVRGTSQTGDAANELLGPSAAVLGAGAAA